MARTVDISVPLAITHPNLVVDNITWKDARIPIKSIINSVKALNVFTTTPTTFGIALRKVSTSSGTWKYGKSTDTGGAAVNFLSTIPSTVSTQINPTTTPSVFFLKEGTDLGYLSQGYISYTPTSYTSNFSITFDFYVWDGTTNTEASTTTVTTDASGNLTGNPLNLSSKLVTYTVPIKIKKVDFTFNPSPPPTLFPTIVEDSDYTIITVKSIVDQLTSNYSITPTNRGLLLASITGIAEWHYSIDNGYTWINLIPDFNNISTASQTDLKLIALSGSDTITKLRIKPMPNINSSQIIRFYAWDTLGISNGDIIYVQTTGQSTIYATGSSNTITIPLENIGLNVLSYTRTITSVADKPVLDGYYLKSVTQSDTTPINLQLSTLFATKTNPTLTPLVNRDGDNTTGAYVLSNGQYVFVTNSDIILPTYIIITGVEGTLSGTWKFLQSTSIPVSNVPWITLPSNISVTNAIILTSSSFYIRFVPDVGTTSGYSRLKVVSSDSISLTGLGSSVTTDIGTTQTIYRINVSNRSAMLVSDYEGYIQILMGSAVPTPPRNAAIQPITNTGSFTGFSLTWQVPENDMGSAITSYNVYRNSILQTSVSGLSATIPNTGLSANTEYSFWITAVNSAGESLVSNIVKTTLSAPTAPQTLEKTVISDGNSTDTDLSLSWLAPSSINGSPVTLYNIYDNGILITTSTTLSKIISISSITENIVHTYTVKAVNEFGESLASNSITYYKGSPSVPQNVEANLAISNGITTGITVSWQAPGFTNGAPITGYSVYKDNILVATGNFLTTTLTESFINGTTYSFTVKATNAFGESLASSIVSVLYTGAGGKPQLTTPLTVTLSSITKNTQDYSGYSVTNILGLISSNYTPNDLTDTKCIAITNTPSTDNGVWQYLLYDYYEWNTIPSVTSPSCFLLDTVSKIRFIPSTDYTGSAPILQFRAWDKKSAVDQIGSTYVVSDSSLSFSTEIGSFSLEVVDLPTEAQSLQASRASPTSTTINLSWAAPSNTGSSTVSYKVYSVNAQSQKTLLTTTSELSYAASGFTIAGTYSFAVLAFNNSGDASTDATTNITISFDVKPSAARSLQAVHPSSTASSVDLSWQAPLDSGSSVVSYKVFNIDDANQRILLGTTLSLSFTANIPGSGTYRYTILATSSVGDADSESNIVMIDVTVEQPYDSPTLPANSTITLTSIQQTNSDPDGDGLQGILGNLGISGIAIRAVSSGNGTWQYATALTTNYSWTNMPVLSTDQYILFNSDESFDKIRFVPNGSYSGTQSFTYKVWDLNGGVYIGDVITIDSSNSKYFSTNTGTGSISIISSAVKPSAARSLSGSQSTPNSSTINLNWQAPLTTGSSTVSYKVYSINALNQKTLLTTTSNLNYAATGYTTSGSYKFSVLASNSAGDADSEPNVTVTVTIHTPPQLNGSQTVTLSTIQEDDVTSSGTSISSIITALGSNYVKANVSDNRGIGIYTAQSTNGSWQYSTNNGLSWQAFPTVTNTSVLVLTEIGNTNKIRFIPNANFNGTVTFGFYAWDTLTGTPGNVVTTTGTQSFSTGIATGSLQVTAVHDAPVLSSGSYFFPAIASINNAPMIVSTETILSAFTVSSADEILPQNMGLAIVSTSGSSIGTWSYSRDNKTTWSPMTSVSATQAIHLSRSTTEFVKFMPATTTSRGSISLEICIWDKSNSGSIVSNIGNASVSGGSSAYSALSATLTGNIGVSPSAMNVLPPELSSDKTYVDFMWDEPSDNGNLPVKYKLYRIINNAEVLEADNIEYLNYTVSGLEEGNTYTFVLKAFNIAGIGPSSTPIIVNVQKSKPLPPQNFTITNPSGTNIYASWEPPSNTVQSGVTGYKIYLVKNNIQTFDKNVTTLNTYIAPKIMYGQTITVRITAYNGIEESEFASSSLIFYGYPDKPTNVKSVSNEANILITWNAPTSTGGIPLLHYKIYKNGQDLNITTTETSYTIEGSTMFTPGLITIKAVNQANIMGLASTDKAYAYPYQKIQTANISIKTTVDGTSNNVELNNIVLSVARAQTETSKEMVGFFMNSIQEKMNPSSTSEQKLADNFTIINTIASDANQDDTEVMKQMIDINTTAAKAAIKSDVLDVKTDNADIVDSLKTKLNTILNSTTSLTNIPELQSYAKQKAVEIVLKDETIQPSVAVVTALTTMYANISSKTTIMNTLKENKGNQSIAIGSAELSILKGSINSSQKSSEFEEASEILVKIPSMNNDIDLTGASTDKPIYLALEPNVNYNFKFLGSSVSALYDTNSTTLTSQNQNFTIGNIITIGGNRFKVIQLGTVTLLYLPTVTIDGVEYTAATALNASQLTDNMRNLTQYNYEKDMKLQNPDYKPQYKSQTDRLYALMGRLNNPQAVALRRNGGDGCNL
jgi:hypothetical protein